MKKILLSALFLMISTMTYSQIPCPGVAAVTYSGKIYNTVQIGTQCWLKENLDIGSLIPGTVNQSNNGLLEKYCYQDDPANCDVYGGLYTWNEAMKYLPSKNLHGICPSGWHIPTSIEYNTLVAYVKNDANALKAVGQGTGSYAGTNTSGFTGMLAGSRGTGGHYTHRNVYEFLWNSTDYDNVFAFVHVLDYSSGDVISHTNGKEAAFSVRCIKDDQFTDVREAGNEEELSAGYALSQNYPNPFNPVTRIEYNLPYSGMVTIKVFDILGREVKSLIEGNFQAGNHSVNFDGSGLSSGIYYYKMTAGNFTQTRKLILLK